MELSRADMVAQTVPLPPHKDCVCARVSHTQPLFLLCILHVATSQRKIHAVLQMCGAMANLCDFGYRSFGKSLQDKCTGQYLSRWCMRMPMHLPDTGPCDLGSETEMASHRHFVQV